MKKAQNSSYEAKLSYAFESIVRKHKEKFGKYFAIAYLENGNENDLMRKSHCNDWNSQIELIQQLSDKISQIQKK
ncbi:MAG: hypothetical protein NZ516_05425 [Raineya sp.]|nr:hypothetical protein [Raineya sp.]